MESKFLKDCRAVRINPNILVAAVKRWNDVHGMPSNNCDSWDKMCQRFEKKLPSSARGFHGHFAYLGDTFSDDANLFYKNREWLFNVLLMLHSKAAARCIMDSREQLIYFVGERAVLDLEAAQAVVKEDVFACNDYEFAELVIGSGWCHKITISRYKSGAVHYKMICA